ncbi:MAG: aspartate/glutamate racemase family protein [Bacteroidales bacterium]|nr:aspartate/glutamate racemase family protein [Bacteroidales bacterium]
MKTIGLIGGMSWESSLEYYRIINEKVKKELGGLHSAQSVMYSVDFEHIKILQHEGKWDELTTIMVDAAKNLEKAGAEILVICTNTMHKMADDVQSNIKLPLLHIADATAKSIKEKHLKKLGLLGTKFTMEQEFYKGRLSEKHGLDVVIPNDEDREIVHKIIYNELCLGNIKDSSKNEYIRIIENLVQNGAEGIILGCTEIPLLVKQADVSVPVFDTTTIHAESAVMESIKG